MAQGWTIAYSLNSSFAHRSFQKSDHFFVSLFKRAIALLIALSKKANEQNELKKNE